MEVRCSAMFGQQTPRRWGWGTPLKKRTATRTASVYGTVPGFVNWLLALEIEVCPGYSAAVNHSGIDKVSLALARHVVERLRVQPELLEVARANLSRWKQRNADSPSLLRCYAEWEAILTRPLEEICALLVAETEEGQRLRQNSPFAGVLSPTEVWEIKDRFRHAAKSA